jgi:hypothetical protein
MVKNQLNNLGNLLEPIIAYSYGFCPAYKNL